MITLLNGRGQLGDSLKKEIENQNTEKQVFIYHTWNVWDKKSDLQVQEYKKFKEFVDENKNSGRMIFISTYSENDNYYVYYKQKSEAYLLMNWEDSIVLRLPSLIGSKGIFKRLKNRECSPYGVIQIMSLEKASKKILEFVDYKGLSRVFTITGEDIKADTLSELLHIF